MPIAICARHSSDQHSAIYLAMFGPDKFGPIPGVMQGLSPEVGERPYNRVHSTTASRRHTATITQLRADLGPRRRVQKG